MGGFLSFLVRFLGFFFFFVLLNVYMIRLFGVVFCGWVVF